MVNSGMFKKHQIVAACLFIVGLIFLIKQIATGFDGYLQQYPWGMYIGLFFTAAGGGAGLLIVIGFGLLNDVIGIPQAKKLYTLALAMLITAGCLIFADLGYPGAILNMITSPNLTAPMNADALALFAAIIVSVLAVLFMQANGTNKKGYAAAGMIIGFILLAVESWLVVASVRQDIWAVMLGAGPALLQALTIGIAAVLCFADHNARYWRNGLLMALLLLLAVQFIDLLAGLGNQNHLGAQMGMLARSYTFWLATVGMVLALLIGVLAAGKKPESIWHKSMAFLVIFSIAMAKLAVIWAGQSVAALSQLEFMQKPHLAVTELLVVVGMIGLGILIYELINRFIRVFRPEQMTESKGASL